MPEKNIEEAINLSDIVREHLCNAAAMKITTTYRADWCHQFFQ